jgi:gluconokinase
MGVAGCGKTAVGQKMSESLGYKFVDGDDHHSATNLKKMRNGIPLTDDDRIPWLSLLNKIITDSESKKQPIILACSAIKKDYREKLSQDSDCIFVYLKISRKEAIRRLTDRVGHYFKADLIDSQFSILEEPENLKYIINAEQTIPKIVDLIKFRIID